MPARGLTALAVLAGLGVIPVSGTVHAQDAGDNVPCCRGGGSGGGGSGGGSAGPGGIASWVSTGGSVRPPAGTTSCGPWDHTANMSEQEGVADLGTVDIRDGVIWNLLYRICEPDRIQFLWVPEIDPEDLAEAARQEVERLLDTPTITLSPGAEASGYVNLETWLAVEPMDDVSATAGPLPPDNLTATTTATAVSIEWVTGDPDVGTLVCDLWGELPGSGADEPGQAPCGWTPRYPSTPEFGIGGGAYVGSVTVVWDVSWSASNGDGGDLGQLRTTTPVSYRVREIQTVGTDG